MTLRRRCGHALVLIGAQLLMACQASAAPPSEKAFAAEMRKRLEAKLKVSLDPVKGEPLSFRIPPAGNGGEDGVLNLHRIYGFCLNVPKDECEDIKTQFVERISLTPPPVTAESLRLVVRDQHYLDHLQDMESGSEAQDFAIHRPIGDDLHAFLAAEGPTTVAMVTPSALKETGLTPEAAWTRASRQTKALLPAVPDAEMLAGKLVVFEGHDFGSALLLQTTAWRKLATAIGPDLLITIVSDQMLLVGVKPDGPELDGFAESVAEDCKEQPRCISPHVYRFRKGKWVIAR